MRGIGTIHVHESDDPMMLRLYRQARLLGH